MGISISVFTNHNLMFNNVIELKRELDNRLATETKYLQKGLKINKSNEHVPTEYFLYNAEFAEYMYEQHNVYYINTNSEICETIRISKSAIRFNFPYNVNHKFHTWYNVITAYYEIDEELRKHKEEYAKQKKQWNLYLDYVETVSMKLGADKILFLNDSTYEKQEDDLTIGTSFAQVQNSLDNSQMSRYNEIMESKKKIRETEIYLLKEMGPADNKR